MNSRGWDEIAELLNFEPTMEELRILGELSRLDVRKVLRRAPRNLRNTKTLPVLEAQALVLKEEKKGEKNNDVVLKNFSSSTKSATKRLKYLRMKLHAIESMEEKVRRHEITLDEKQQAKVNKKKEVQNLIKAVEKEIREGNVGILTRTDSTEKAYLPKVIESTPTPASTLTCNTKETEIAESKSEDDDTELNFEQILKKLEGLEKDLELMKVENDAFGKYVALELNKLPPFEQCSLKRDISNLISDYLLKGLADSC